MMMIYCRKKPDFKFILTQIYRFTSQTTSAENSVSTTVTLSPSELFEQKKKEELENAAKFLEKIEVTTPDGRLLMNKSISTPRDCAYHFRGLTADRSAVSLVDGQPWDMQRPLQNDCHLEWLSFKTKRDPQLANEVFWRTGSVLIGYVMKKAFKESVEIDLCSFPPPNITSGSFVYDMKVSNLPDKNWRPSISELTAMSIIGQRLALEDVPIERLEVSLSLAEQLFVDSPLKLTQLAAISAASTNSRLVVYRIGDFLELSKGPLLAHTGIVGRFQITGWHAISTPDYGDLIRVQGFALPTEFLTHSLTWNFLARRATFFNKAKFPQNSSAKPTKVSE